VGAPVSAPPPQADKPMDSTSITANTRANFFFINSPPSFYIDSLRYSDKQMYYYFMAK
jgi:hypothetical protein